MKIYRMKNLMYTGYFFLLYMKISWGEKQITLHVDDSNPHTLTSPHFPSCCESIQYFLVSDHHSKSSPSNWRLLFTDLDIPPGSELLIYGYKEKDSVAQPLHSPKYSPEGMWLRPAIIYQGYGLGIEFMPLKSDSKHYLGFNATYWLTHETEWKLDRPLTICPAIGDIMEGGTLEVEVLVHPFAIHNYRFFCIWQLKPPPSQDLRMYIDIYSAHDSNVKIRQGTHSGKPLLFEMHTLDAQVKLPKRLTSDHGLYIELDKPTDSGNFTIVYGVYKTVNTDEVCQYFIDKEKLEGFRCKVNISSWCIPQENKCNGIKDCPDGEDEDGQLCREILTTPAPTGKPCMWHQCADGRCRNIMERCPEEGCPKYAPHRCNGTLQCINTKMQSCPGDKTCPMYTERYCEKSKKCIRLYETCEEEKPKLECDHSYGKKLCRDGTCKRTSQRCPEDPCPAYKPNKCETQCYYNSEKCNSISECSDGSDEEGCLSASSLNFNIIGSFLVVGTTGGLLFIIFCAFRRVKMNRLRQENAQPVMTENRERLMPFSGGVIQDNRLNSAQEEATGLGMGFGLPPSYQEAMVATTENDIPQELPPSYNELVATSGPQMRTPRCDV